MARHVGERLWQTGTTVPTIVFPDGTVVTNPSAKDVKKRLAAANGA